MAVTYKCVNCNYQFTIQNDRKLSGCPYCNKNTLRTVSRGPGFSSKLVDEA